MTNAQRYAFPFGAERTGTPPRKPAVGPAAAFVIGVYPSAVHARWTVDGKVMSGALAVAPEPCSFWDGEGGREIVQTIARGLPCEAGTLTSARGANGRSGKTLDRYYLEPLELTPDQCWMTDLDEFYYVPRQPVGPRKDNEKRTQRDVLDAYERFRLDKCPDLPPVNLPDRPAAIGAPSDRLRELECQLRESKAKVVITLGSEPIPFVAPAVLLELDAERYGHLVPVRLWGMEVLLLRLCHPRQAGGLGAHSEGWKMLHATWTQRVEKRGGLSALLRSAQS